jgi:hypothetical protein
VLVLGDLNICARAYRGKMYHLRGISIRTGILNWLRFTYDFELGSAELCSRWIGILNWLRFTYDFDRVCLMMSRSRYDRLSSEMAAAGLGTNLSAGLAWTCDHSVRLTKLRCILCVHTQLTTRDDSIWERG